MAQWIEQLLAEPAPHPGSLTYSTAHKFLVNVLEKAVQEDPHTWALPPTTGGNFEYFHL